MALKDETSLSGILCFHKISPKFKVHFFLLFFWVEIFNISLLATILLTTSYMLFTNKFRKLKKSGNRNRNYFKINNNNNCFLPGFVCHDQGASSVILAPQHQLLISGGKKGDINIFDVRQRQQRHRFQAHESAIKCLALDPHEEFFVSGAGDGDIKVNSSLLISNFTSFSTSYYNVFSFYSGLGSNRPFSSLLISRRTS